MGTKLPTILITMGDPAGVGPEIILKALSRREIYEICRPVVIGDCKVMDLVLATCGSLRTKEGPRLNPRQEIKGKASDFGTIDILDLKNVNLKDLIPGTTNAMCGKAAFEYIKRAVDILKNGEISAVVTCPICKKSMEEAGLSYPGHTELLAELTGTRDFAMMFIGGSLRVVLVTRHLALRDVVPAVTKERIIIAITLAEKAMKALGIGSPRIVVCALNPHAGEWGILGKEEIDIITPAIEEVKKQGIEVSGPLPSDKAIYDTARGTYDLAIAMYHDQGQIPIKLLSYWRSVNITLGLPFVRTSPCHGTAFDIVGQDKADPQSLIEAIKLAVRLGGNLQTV